MQKQQKPNWRIIWKALHDMIYDRIEMAQAIEAITAAGHPAAVYLVHKTVREGYSLSRDLCQDYQLK